MIVATRIHVCSPTVLAWVNVGLHLAGLGLAAASMQPGTPLVSLNERLLYLASTLPRLGACLVHLDVVRHRPGPVPHRCFPAVGCPSC